MAEKEREGNQNDEGQVEAALNDNFEIKRNCSEVLENNTIDDYTTGPMDTITQKQSGKRKVKVKKKSAVKMKVSAPEPDISEKKSVKSNKQKKSEEYRRMKEVEKMVEEQKLRMEKDREKEQKKEEDNEKLVRQRVLPTYDVVSAMEATCSKTEKNDKQAADVASGAIPKQRKLIAASNDKDGKIERKKESGSLKKAGSLVETEVYEEYRQREVSGAKEKCNGEETVKDRFDDPATENGSGNERDGMENHLNTGVVWPEEGQKKEEKVLSYENVQHGGFFENQDVFSLHRDNQGADDSGRGENKIDQGTLELLKKFFRERFGNGDKIIEEFLQWIEETKARKRQPFSQRGEYPSPQEASSVTQSKSQVKEPSHESRKGKYKKKYRKIHPRYVGFEIEPYDQRKRLKKSVTRDEFPDLGHLRTLIREQPSTYRRAILQLDSKAGHLSFAVVSDTITPDIKISGRVRGAFDMDQVVVKVLNKRSTSSDDLSSSRGKFVGVMHPIISHKERQFVCRIDPENKKVMIPINKSVPKIFIRSSARGEDGVESKDLLGEECMFLVQFLKWEASPDYPSGTIIRRLPQQPTLKNSMEILFAEHCISELFSGECDEQVKSKFPPSWLIPVEEERRRLKIDGAFTIDPENSKDLDDALSVEKLHDSGLYRVGVHIADVSYFVKPDTPLDKEALSRCSSYYPVHGPENVPMLPRGLSENHCSLLHNKSRLCLSIFLNMSEDESHVENSYIKETIVKSTCQLTYSQAQQVINGQDCSSMNLAKETVDKVRQLSDLAQKMRKWRLREAAFDHWSSKDEPGDYEAHELVEEMMIAANKEIAKFLYSRDKMITPLRTQLPPKKHRLSSWLKKFGKFIKFSLFPHAVYSDEELQKMTRDEEISEFPKFMVQKSVWFDLFSAAETLDKVKLCQLTFSEKYHSQLAIAKRKFERIQQKARYACEGDPDEEKEKLGHFFRKMDPYTHFTSPIRRYIDIVVHRLVLNLISEDRRTEAPLTEGVVEMCRRSTFANANSKHFKKACKQVHLAAMLREKSHEIIAVVSTIEDHRKIRLEITKQEYDQVAQRQREIELSTLQPFDAKRGGSKEVVLTWKLRLYIAPEGNIVEKLDREREKVSILLSQELPEREVFYLPGERWKKLLKALQEENFELVTSLIRELDQLTRPREQKNLHNDGKVGSNMEYTHEKQISIKKFDTVSIQLTAHMTHGVFHPEIQLFKITPSVHICVEHRKYPRECFTTAPCHQISGKYSTLVDYIAAWEPVLDLEAATVAVNENDELTIHNLDVRWKINSSGNQEGFFSLQSMYYKSRHINIYEGDFVCVRVPEKIYLAKSIFVASEGNNSEMDLDLENEGQLAMKQLKGTPSLESNSSGSSRSSIWVGHCIVGEAKLNEESKIVSVRINLCQSASEFPKELLIGGIQRLSTLTIIHRPPIHRRMSAVLRRGLKNAPKLVEAICLGHEPSQGDFELPPFFHFSISERDPTCRLEPLNKYQNNAVKDALEKPFSLIQGPPGTGKTMTGAHIAYWFAYQNKTTISPSSQVIYCGPSNKSIDVVAEIMLKIRGLKILRVYSDLKEQAEFPLPNKPKPLRSSNNDDEAQELDEKLKEVALHHVIRADACPFAYELKEYEKKFVQDKKKGLRTEDKHVDSYRELIEQAETWAFQSTGVQVILCTCAVSVKSSLMKSCKDNIKQCIVDECGMCMELESLLPIAFLAPQQVVLIGDHKQLQPVIHDKKAQNLGLQVSMFERLSGQAKMLQLQYRMRVLIAALHRVAGRELVLDSFSSNFPPLISTLKHHFCHNNHMSQRSVDFLHPFCPCDESPEDQIHEIKPTHEEICKFPSEYFYNNQLETDSLVKEKGTALQSFWPVANVPMAFCHVVGEEEITVIKTALSNEQSKANVKEVRKAVHVAKCLIKNRGVSSSKIAILSPYKEQQARIRKALAETSQCKDICVTTIAKSQGTEWNYVILSLVRSLSDDDLDSEPSMYWVREHLGFLADEHLMNVGLTRARKGLCIIGNKNLLKHHSMWNDLIESFEKRHCVVNESTWPKN